jgi:hypothetical protein
MFDTGAFLALGLALPVPILWALSGTFVGKWFSDFDDYACIAVTFVMAAGVVIPSCQPSVSLVIPVNRPHVCGAESISSGSF